nr:MAG TPA: hypothetical protein [Bacteriophage sp.]
MASKKIQLYTDRANTIEASPETSANCVILSDGNDLQKVLDNDLTSPTVVHEETSFKVGVGDIDVSSSVVDGEVGRMVIKGKTYQNILPEPSTHVLTNNKEMFKVNEGLDPNVEIVDAVSKSAILTGQTLVNISKFVGSIDRAPGRALSLGNGMVKSNATYMIMFNLDVINDISKIKIEAGKDGLWVSDISMNVVTLGINKFIVSTPDKDINEIKITNPQQSSTSITMSNIMLFEHQDNMENWNIPYFEDMASCKMPVLSTCGKNLFNINKEPLAAYGVKYSIDNDEIIVNSNGEIGYQNIAFTLDKILLGKTIYTSYELVEHTSDNWHMQFVYTNINGTTIYTSGKSGKTTFPNEIIGDLKLSILPCNSSTTGVSHTLKIKNIQIEENSVATAYEPHKTNILHTPEEVVLRSLPNGVCDTLNLNTGEYVQRIGEIVLNGTQGFTQDVTSGDFKRFTLHSSFVSNMKVRGAIMCDKFVQIPDAKATQEGITTGGSENYRLMLWVESSRLSTPDVAGLQAWLQQNPVTVQYELTTPVVKTVDLSTSGNWEKIVLNGSESWNGFDPNYGCAYTGLTGKAYGFSNVFAEGFSTVSNYANAPLTISGTPNNSAIWLSIGKSIATLDQFKHYLSQNPVTVWYQTATTLDSTQVKQPIFFKDGHVQLSSGVDNSLVPTLDYQAKTSNSYVMDLMKTNTKYTMKAKSASGTLAFASNTQPLSTNGKFAVDGASFQNANKLMVINGSVEDLMVLEGDLTSKTIPYFKGIKSAFEDESKIEVLSSNCANLFHPKDIVNDNYWELDVTGKTKIFLSAPRRNAVNMVQRDSNGIELMARVNEAEDQIEILPNAKTLRLVGGCFRPTDAWYELITQNLIVADAKSENNTKEIDYKSNNTKIPLLSPLRSLPNGVCDELIIDRMKKKATLIQRVGYTELNGDNSEQWGVDVQKNSRSGFVTRKQYNQKVAGGQNAIVAEHLLAIDDTGRKYDLDYTITMGNIPTYPFVITIPSHIINERGDSFTTIDNAVSKFKRWLSKAPISVVYQLATPIVTEIDLENFPLIYKDGHIFLNSEIAPVVEIDYNVNQTQLIIGNGETLLRHEQEILDLDKLIVSFVDCEYRLRLLKFDMELSMMSL